MASKQMLENLETKFGMAKSLVDDLSELVEEFTSNDLIVLPNEQNLPTTIDDSPMINIGFLKQDFQLVRQNIIKLVNSGQRILDEACELDLSDMKPSTLSALSELQSTIGNNLKLLIDMYKTMTDIEKNVKPTKGNINESSSGIVNNTQNNVIFAGSSSALLELIPNQNKD